MNFLNRLFNYSKIQQKTGYIDDLNRYISRLPKHEIFGSNNSNLVSWNELMPPFRYQESTMMCTAFAMTNIISALNKKETGEMEIFSPLELFTRSNGSVLGNTIENTEKAAIECVYYESDCPWVGIVSEWSPFILKILGEYARARKNWVSMDRKKYAIKGLTRVIPIQNQIRLALADSPLLAILAVGKGYFDKIAPANDQGPRHAVVITSVNHDGTYTIFDSLTVTKDFNGFHILAANYPFFHVFGVLDLPNDWEKKQKELVNASFQNVKNRYGKIQDFKKELIAIQELELAKKKNPTHATFLAENWEVYINAIAYGGYSIQDILNHISSIRRSGKGIFFFDVIKK